MNSLKSKMTAATLAIFLAGLWPLSFYLGYMLKKDMEQLLGDQQFAIISRLAAEVDHELDDRLKGLDIVAQSITPALWADARAMQQHLESRQVFQTLFNGGTFITGRDGAASASVPRELGRFGGNYRDHDYIATTLDEGRATIGSPAMGPLLQAPTVGMAAPIRDARGVVVGALAGVINLGKPIFLDRITDSRYGTVGGYLLVAPPSRLVINAADKSRILERLPAVGVNPDMDRFLAGYEGAALWTTPTAVEMLTAGKGIRAAGWVAYSALPTTEAFAPVYAMQRRLLLVSTVLTLAAGAMLWWLLRRQLAPLAAAAQQVTDMADQPQTLKLLPPGQPDEVGRLIGGFNHLIATLGQREAALKDSAQTLRTILETTQDGYWRVSTQGQLLEVNSAYCKMSGYTAQALCSMHIPDLEANESSADTRAHLQRLIRDGNDQFESTHRRKDGSLWVVEVSAIYSPHHGGQIYAFLRDITERKRAEEQLHLAASVFTHAREGIMVTATDGTIKEVNEAFTRITGYSRSEALGQNPRMLHSGRQNDAFYATLWNDLKALGYWSGEIWNRRKNGELYAEMLTVSAERDAQGQAQRYVALFSDITTLIEHQRQLEHLAHFDALTGLPNRVLLADRLQQSMAQTQRRHRQLAVVYLDLDSFKSINDQHGHGAGDQLLVTLTARLKEVLREGDTLARIGGDEFVAVLVDLPSVADSVPVLSRMLAAAALPMEVDGHVLQVSASLGVTFYPQTEEVDADQLLRQADQAMYQAKLAGKKRYHLFDAEQDRTVRGHHESLDLIRQGLLENQFVLYYQPKVDMRQGVVIGAEALIRWQHPTRGLLLPQAFLPSIEDDPLAIDLGEWVIDTALAQMQTWHAQGLRMAVSVNIGARQLQQPDFVPRLQALLAKHPSIRPGDLELEILETSALEDLAWVSQVMQECRGLGIHFALDDFGTGYSSLTYLKRLPVTLLKIDQSFVRGMLDDPDDLAILDGVIGLSKAFRREVIAEGMETAEHGEMLLQLGCDLAQGYGIARPMPASALPAWLANWQPHPSWRSTPLAQHEDLPLLRASVELRAWTKAMDNYFTIEADPASALDPQHSAFGDWLNQCGAARYGAHASFAQVVLLHQQMQGVAMELHALKTQGQPLQARSRSHELRELGQSLLHRVKNLAQPNPA